VCSSIQSQSSFIHHYIDYIQATLGLGVGGGGSVDVNYRAIGQDAVAAARNGGRRVANAVGAGVSRAGNAISNAWRKLWIEQNSEFRAFLEANDPELLDELEDDQANSLLETDVDVNDDRFYEMVGKFVVQNPGYKFVVA
jgi:hypothetical protein